MPNPQPSKAAVKATALEWNRIHAAADPIEAATRILGRVFPTLRAQVLEEVREGLRLAAGRIETAVHNAAPLPLIRRQEVLVEALLATLTTEDGRG